MRLGLNALRTMPRSCGCCGASIAKKDSAAATMTSGMSSMKMPGAELNTSGLREISLMCSAFVIAQKPRVFSSGASSSDSAGGCHETGSFWRSHLNAARRSARSRSQNANVSISVATGTVLMI